MCIVVAGCHHAPATPATPSPTSADVIYDHSACTTSAAAQASQDCSPTYPLRRHLNQGDIVTILIINTDPTSFTYSIDQVTVSQTVAQTSASRISGAGKVTAPKQTQLLTQVYSTQYGGYIVHVTPTAGAANTLGLGAATIAVALPPNPWQLGFAGGFAGSGLNDPSYAVINRTVSTGSGSGSATTTYIRPTLENNSSGKSDINLGLAAFVHLSHADVELAGIYPALTFGLGVQSQTGITYYPGLSFLFADKAAITVGAALGPIKTLPAGTRIGDSVASANVLTNLPTHYVSRLFVAFSYAFIGGSQAALQKPFAGSSGSGGQPQPAPGSAPQVKQHTTTGPLDALKIGDLLVTYPRTYTTLNLAATDSNLIVKLYVDPTRTHPAASGIPISWAVDTPDTGGVDYSAQSTTNDNGEAVATIRRIGAGCYHLQLWLSEQDANGLALPNRAGTVANPLVFSIRQATTPLSACQ